MKRNYTKAAIRMLTACALLVSGVFASAQAQEWQPVNNRGSIHPAQAHAKSLTQREKYRQAMGIVNPMGKIAAAHDGERPTPRVAQRPNNILRSPENPRAQMYGIVNRHATMTYNTDAFLGKIDLANGKVTPLFYNAAFCPYTGSDYELQANAYRKGQIICPAYTQDDEGVTGSIWTIVDFETGKVVDTIDFKTETYANAYAMTYDTKADKIYLVAIDDVAGTDGIFCVVDPNDPKKPYNLIMLDNLRKQGGNFIAALAYNPEDDQIYAFNNFNQVFTVDKNDGTLLQAGDINSDYLYFTEGVTGQIVYSPADKMFITLYRDNSIRANRVIYIHPETFEVFEGEIVAPELTPYFSAIFTIDDYAPADAPELAGVPNFNFANESLSGTISFTAPSFTYVGVSLEGSTVKTIAKIDGNEVYNANTTPGQTVTLNQTLTEGLHEIEITSYIGENASPVRRASFYVGYDIPKAPSQVKLNGDELSWNRVTGKGVNNGYVNSANITYDVYMNGVKQNSEPISGNTFTLTAPAQMSACTFGVTASANGHTSAPGELNQVYGKALTLPFKQEPTREESKLYRYVNANNDDKVWFWTDERDSNFNDDLVESREDQYGWCMSVGYYNDADDWLFFPLINFDSSDKLYSFSFDVCGIFSIPTVESYEIYLAKEPTVQSCFEGLNIYSDAYFEVTTSWQHKELNFAVKEPGDYYLAIRVNSTKANSAQGLLFNDFDIHVAQGKSTAVPADPDKVVIIPDENGDSRFTANITIPTLDITGKPLPADDEITITMTYDVYTKTATGKPGEVVTLTMSTNYNGFANIGIVPSNKNGNGYPRTHRAYIGIDRPLCPTNIKGGATADNLSFDLTWDAPGAIGENGGHVIVDELKYNIYTQSGISLSKIGETTDTKFRFTPYTGDVTPLATYYMGPAAVNEGGESRNSLFVMDDLGTPYELPVKEEWGTQTFNMMPYTFLTDNTFKGSSWENVSNLTGMNLGDPRFIEGGVFGTATAGPCDVRIVTPKVTTTGISKVNFILRYWDYKNGPESIEVYGRRFDMEGDKLLGSFNLKRENDGEWVDGVISMPADFCNCPWIQIRFGSHMIGGEYEYLIADSYQIMPDADYDLKVTELNGLNQVSVGDQPTYDIVVANAGRERIGGQLLVECISPEGKVIASDQVEVVNLNSNQVFEHSVSFDITGEFRNMENFIVRATAITDNDENTANNVREIKPRVMGSQLPVVNDLQGEVKDGGVQLSWSTPDTEYGDFENFETMTPFKITDKIGQFDNVDLDKQYPIGLQNGDSGIKLEWEGSDLPQAWTVLNMEDLKMMNDSRIAPHSGTQLIMARPAGYDETVDEPIQSSKWLISPEIKEQTEVSFWFSSLSSSYTEYVELWVSTTDKKFDPNLATLTRNGSWRREKAWSKSGAENWEFVSHVLPRRAKYFAIRYCSYDGTALVIDDLTFTPVEKLNREIDHYALYRSDNGEEPKLVAGAENLTATSFTDNTWADSKARYFVTTHSKVEDAVKEGPKSNVVFINGSGVNEISAVQSVAGGIGKIRVNNFEGADIIIATADGKVVVKGKVLSNQAYYSLDKGIYIVSAGNTNTKVVVK